MLWPACVLTGRKPGLGRRGGRCDWRPTPYYTRAARRRFITSGGIDVTRFGKTGSESEIVAVKETLVYTRGTGVRPVGDRGIGFQAVISRGVGFQPVGNK